MKIRIALILLIIIPIVACMGGKAPPLPVQEIETASVHRDNIERKILFTGNIVAQDAFDVYPRATGKVLKKLLKEGDHVKRGQAILLLERDEVGYTFKSMPVVSLVDGLVGKIDVDAGAYVDTQTPVATVVHTGEMRVKLDVPERYLNVILPKTDVEIFVDYLDGETFKGTIATSSPVIDPKTRTANVEVYLPNTEGRLRHGMFGRINIVVEKRENTLVVPNGSISWEGEKQFVYKVEGGKVTRKEVKTGLRNETHVEILEGINEGDVLAVTNLLDLRDGETVKVVKNRENS